MPVIHQCVHIHTHTHTHINDTRYEAFSNDISMYQYKYILLVYGQCPIVNLDTKVPGYQIELPWLAILCACCHTSTELIKHCPYDSTGENN